MMVVLPPPWELETAVFVGVFGMVESSAGLGWNLSVSRCLTLSLYISYLTSLN